MRETKRLLQPGKPFGVDLLLPKVGKGARATNSDYTKGQLGALVEVIIEEGATLFVCAVGVPSKAVVDRFHERGVIVSKYLVGS